MQTECGDLVQVLWPGKGLGYHIVLGHDSESRVILSVTNDTQNYNVVVPESQIEAIIAKHGDLP